VKRELSVPLLELRNVTKYYHGTTPALGDVSFSVTEGEFVSVIREGLRHIVSLVQG